VTNYELIASAEGQDGDFAVRLTDDALKPWFSPGQTVYLRRSTRLENGDVGLFFSKGGMVFRQYCRDSEGIIYLFSLDRSRAEEDLRIPAAGEKPVCYGKLVLSKPIPLPMD
jgi:SOS-response transcriptional repressor LexA